MSLEPRDKPRYRRFSEYLRQRYDQPIRKISLDAGFTCPNRDGNLSHEGCIYCLPPSFAPASGPQRLSLQSQLQAGIAQGKKRSIQQFIAYFQAYTNTYAPLGVLRQTYDTIRDFPEIKMLMVGTRPDCVDVDSLALLNEYAQEYEVWVEYGLQSMKDETLTALNRGHTAQRFVEAVALTRRHPRLKIGVHVILGLPGETPEDELQTAETLGALQVEGVKIHPLHVVRNTPLEMIYQAGKYLPLTLPEYATRVAAFLEKLWPETIVLRLSADCPSALLVAPDWLKEKAHVLSAIEDGLKARDTWQGKRYT